MSGAQAPNLKDSIPMKNDESERRAYWTAQLEQAFAFMERVRTYPVAECGEKLVSLVAAVKGTGIRVEFSSKPHALGLPRQYYLREGQIAGFLGAAREMN